MIKKIKLYLIVFFILLLAACGEGGKNSVDCDVNRQFVLQSTPYLQDNGKLFIGDKYYRFEQKVPTSDVAVEAWLDDYIEDEVGGDDFGGLGEMTTYVELYEEITGKDFYLEEWITPSKEGTFIPEVKKLVKKEFRRMPKDNGVFFDTKKNIYGGTIYKNAEVIWGENEIVMTYEWNKEKPTKEYITIHLPGSKLVNAQKDVGKKFDYIIHEGKPDLFFTKKPPKTYITCAPLKVEKSSTEEKPKKTTPEKTKKTPTKETKTSPEETKKAPPEKNVTIPRRN